MAGDIDFIKLSLVGVGAICCVSTDQYTALDTSDTSDMKNISLKSKKRHMQQSAKAFKVNKLVIVAILCLFPLNHKSYLGCMNERVKLLLIDGHQEQDSEGQQEPQVDQQQS